MLELFLQLVEHFQTLLKTRNANNRAIFNDHIEPIYKDMQAVYDDYVSAFQQTRDRLRDERMPLAAIISDLDSKRQQSHRLRQEVATYAAVFNRSHHFPAECARFCVCASRIVLTEPTNLEVPLGGHTTRMGPVIALLEKWSDEEYRKEFSHGNRPATEQEFRGFVAGLLEETLSRLADDWQLLMEEYFELRVKHLRPA